MRVVVLGGGVVGVTTAYQLQKDGHEVVLLERDSEVRRRNELGQRRHDRARPLLRLVLAHGPDNAGEIACSRGIRRSASGFPPIRGCMRGPGCS